MTLPNELRDAGGMRSNGINPMTDDAFVSETDRINAEDKRSSRASAARTQDADVKAFLKLFEAVDADHERMALLLRR